MLDHRRTKTTAALLVVCCVALAELSPCLLHAQHAGDIVDTFDDGRYDDCDPVCWTPSMTLPGMFDAGSGDLEMWNTAQGPTAITADEFREGDLSIRVQAAMRSSGRIALIAHATADLSTYLARVLYSGEVTIRLFNGGHSDIGDGGFVEDFMPEEDHLIQLDIIDDLIELRVWEAREEMPSEPTAWAIDSTHRSGFWGLSYNDLQGGNPDGFRKAIFQYVEVSSAPIDDGERFLRGDCNSDGDVNVADAVCALNSLFGGAQTPSCRAALDVNGDANVNIADPVSLLNFLFAGGPPPVAPFPECGPTALPSDEDLGCEIECG